MNLGQLFNLLFRQGNRIDIPKDGTACLENKKVSLRELYNFPWFISVNIMLLTDIYLYFEEVFHLKNFSRDWSDSSMKI